MFHEWVLFERVSGVTFSSITDPISLGSVSVREQVSEKIIVVRIEEVSYEEKPKGRREECEGEDKDGRMRSRWLKCGWYFPSLQ